MPEGGRFIYSTPNQRMKMCFLISLTNLERVREIVSAKAMRILYEDVFKPRDLILQCRDCLGTITSVIGKINMKAERCGG